MQEQALTSTTAAINVSGEAATALNRILSKHHRKAVFFQDVYQFTAGIAKMGGNGESIVVISGLEEYETEDFAVLKIVREHFAKACFICINDNNLNGSLERVLKAVKAGIEIVSSADITESLIIRFKDGEELKGDNNIADIPKVEGFENRMRGMMGAFFLTSAEQKALKTKTD